LHDDLALSVEKCERQKIVREYGRGDLRDLRKHLPDVEDRGQRAQQFVARLDVPHAVSLERERLLQRLVVLRVLDGERNLIRDQREKREILCLVRVAFSAAVKQHAETAPRRCQGQRTCRLDPVALQVGGGLREPGFSVPERKYERLLMLNHPVRD
jgi:hypothetical protein